MWYFVDNEYYFKRDALYGHYDDGERYGFFSRSIISLLPALQFMPEVIHCNDWQTALVPIYLKDECVRWPEIRGIKTVFTVHNIEYQGRYGKETLEDLFGLQHHELAVEVHDLVEDLADQVQALVAHQTADDADDGNLRVRRQAHLLLGRR